MATDDRLTLVLIRHAIADDRASFARTGRPDSERPLTAEGERKMRSAAAGLHRIFPEFGRLASSPYVRARQTAEIVSEAYGGLAIDELDAAATGDRDALLEALRATPRGTRLAVVGHEPTHGRWTAWLLTGRDAGFIEYKKGECCALAFAREIEPGAARLLWKLRPEQLRALGEGKG